MEHLHKNLTFNKTESIGYWAVKHGWYTCYLLKFNPFYQ